MAKSIQKSTPFSRNLPIPGPILKHHSPAIQVLKKHIPPVLLMTSPSGTGKHWIVYHLSQWLLCEKKSPDGFPLSTDGPCHQCRSCQRALSGNWIDFTEISDSETLKIDRFRELQESMGFSAYESAYRITFIRDADRMTPQAANSLLKILEEPPPAWIFFLTANDPALLLPTLTSRCQILRLQPLTQEILLELLAMTDIPRERHLICAHHSQGSIHRALALAEDEAWEQRKTLLKFLENPAAELNSLLDWAAQETSHFHLLLDLLEQIARDRISTAPQLWIKRAERLFRARQESLAPLNRKLLVQDILMPFLV